MHTVLKQPGATYYYNGKGELHREDGPAIIIREYFKEWWLEGKLHRVGGPAAIHSDGEQYWLYGKRHRMDGPAIDTKRSKQWWINDELHREDGPAIVNGNFSAYYLNNQYFTEENYYIEIKRRRKLMSKYFHKWFLICDQPGKRLFQLLADKNYLEIENLLS